MLHHAYQIHDLKVILELGDSARHTLLQLLEQFNGSNSGKFDRGHMNAAEKQKAKRGIAELKSKKIIIKAPNSSSLFTINKSMISIKKTPVSISERIDSNIDIQNVEGVDILLMKAIEEFFYDFFNTQHKFKIKGKSHLLLPSVYFRDTVDLTNHLIEDIHFIFYDHTHLLVFKRILEMLYSNTNARQQNLDPIPFHKIISKFNRSLDIENWNIYPPTGYVIQAKQLNKYAKEWFYEKFPEVFL
jgi:hypothetical protein